MGDDSDKKKDWFEWHAPYDDPNSALSRRLTFIKDHIRKNLRPGVDTPFRIISICAGQGRDVIDVLSERREKTGAICARLVELDERNIAVARRLAENAGLTEVEIVQGDASFVDAYDGMVPANIVLMCGILGNISIDEVFVTISEMPQLCANGAVLIWTRHRRPPDPTDEIRRAFAESGFDEVEFIAPSDSFWSVGVERFVGEPRPLQHGLKLFTFIEDKP